MESSLSDPSQCNAVAAARKASPRANSVPLLEVNLEDLTTAPVVIAVEGELPRAPLKEPDHVVEEEEEEDDDEVEEDLQEEDDSLSDEDSSRPLNSGSRSVGTSVEIDLNTSVKIPIEPDTEETVQRSPDRPPTKTVGRAATISTSTSTDNEVASNGVNSLPAKTIIPSITSYLNEKAPANAFVVPVKALTPVKDKTEEQDKLLTKRKPPPQIVKTQPSLKKKKQRHFLTRLFSRGAVEEGDGLYEAPCVGGTGGSEEGGGGREARLLQTGDGSVMVEGAEEPEGESSLSILMQVMLPFLVAGLGMVGAGLVLDMVQHWDVFVVISELFIMVPALLGLKGNLEMTLASRLSTHANMGHLDKSEDCISMIVGNLALIQCQAIVVGFLASVAAVVMGWIPQGDFNMLHTLLLCAAALVTASFASFILGVIMVAVILLSRKCRINPDNVATPIAASLGDLTTLGLLAWIASLLFEARGSDFWLAPLIIGGYVLSLPLWVWLASRNKHTKEVLYSGWTPVISAMMISSMGGVILDYTVTSYKGIAVYQPVINGVGGNLVAVQASRISTALHLASPLGRLPRYADKLCYNPGTVFCTNTGHARTARMLLLLVIPGHLVFAYTISYLKAGHTSLTPIFVIVYLCAALLQVVILLYMSVVMVHWMWSVCIDPDNSAIPYLTACGDLLGTGLLAIAFHLLYLVGDRDSDLGD